MKKYLILTLFVLLYTNINAQITLEAIYDTASSANIYFNEIDQLLIVNFEVSGERYVKINRVARSICIYDMNHTLLKTISLASFPTYPNGFMGEVLYLSEKLFDIDSQIEFMYCYTTYTDNTHLHTEIIKEDGTVLFSDTGGAVVHPNWAMQQWPIYNTSHGTKMILSCDHRQAKVFSLPGILSTAIEQANGQLMQTQNGQFSNLYPNPSNGSVTLQYELPKNEKEGELILYNMQGTEVKRYKVDNTFKDVLIDNTQLPAGTYFYQLQTSKGSVGTKKMVVIK